MSGRPWVVPTLEELRTPMSPAREHLVNAITILELERQTQAMSREGGFGPVVVEGTITAALGTLKCALVEVELLERRLQHGR